MRLAYDGARFMACSTNETSTVEQLTYQLDGRYAAFHASVRAWGDTTEPFRIVLKVHTTARQSDGTRTKNYRTFASAVANGPADTVEIRVPQAADLMLELECDRPHLQLVLSDARVSTALMGVRSAAEVEANVAAAEQGPLPPEILEQLQQVADLVPFRPFEEPFGLPFGRAYKGPGKA